VSSALRFAWWNTGLSHSKAREAPSDEDRESVAKVISRLTLEERCSIIALAEVHGEATVEWIPRQIRGTWRCLQEVSRGPQDYDLDLLYDTERVQPELQEISWLTSSFVGAHVRPGVVARFSSQNGNDLVIAAAHWRSNMGGDTKNAESLRSRAAEELRNAIGVTALEGIPVMVLGDLNLEPFEEPLQSVFPTSRYRNLVRRHQQRNSSDTLFYNPAWRWMGERVAWSARESPFSLAGTYHEDRWVPTAWRTFDQVLVSAPLIGEEGWVLRESDLGIWIDSMVFDAQRSRPQKPFDHLPILGTLDLVEKPGQPIARSES
jgi:hypothetical protein